MIVTRFAPSPTGYLHIGGARTALFNYLFARHNNGKFLLRIEDTDKERSTPEACQAIIDSLEWLDLKWDDEIVYQSTRQARHQEAVQELIKNGQAYYCFSSQEEVNQAREEAISKKESFIFHSPWRDRSNNEYPKDIKPVVRLKVPRSGSTSFDDLIQGTITVTNDHLDDMVLLRSDGTPTYMLAVVVDDHDMGVTHIIRGDDHLTNAFRQILLYQAFGWTIPSMGHIPLIYGPDGTKLSKRHGAVGMHLYKDQGYLPEAMCNYLLRLGWSHHNDEIINRDQAIEWFNLESVGKSPARIDFAKLANLNGHYIKNADNHRLVMLVAEELAKGGKKITQTDIERIEQAIPSLKQRTLLLTDLAAQASLYLPHIPPIASELQGSIKAEHHMLIRDFCSKLELLEEISADTVQTMCKEFALKQGLKLGELMAPIRILMTGSDKSPSIFEMIAIIGVKETVERLCRTI